METNKKKSIIIGSVVLLALLAVFAIVYALNKPAAKAGSKDIVIEVTAGNGSSTDYSLSTDAEFLLQAMDELAGNGSGFSYAGSEGEYGIMVEYVNEEKAVYAEDGAYWALYVNGEYSQYGADSQPVENGSTYTWTYEKAQ